jgi:hypothetical protein
MGPEEATTAVSRLRGARERGGSSAGSAIPAAAGIEHSLARRRPLPRPGPQTPGRDDLGGLPLDDVVGRLLADTRDNVRGARGAGGGGGGEARRVWPDQRQRK